MQFCFTTVFGWYAAFVLATTGHLVASIAVHVFCNAMGFPAFHAVNQHTHKAALVIAFIAGIMGFFAMFPAIGNADLYNNVETVHRSNGYVHAILSIT